MEYYAIIVDGKMVGCGTKYMRWHKRTRKYSFCDEPIAQAVADDVSGTLYRADWMSKPETGTVLAIATVIAIDKDEYETNIAKLLDDEDIPFEDSDAVETVEETEESEEDYADQQDDDAPLTRAELLAILEDHELRLMYLEMEK